MTECTKNLSSTFFALANNSVAEGLGGRELTTFFDYVRSWFAELEGSKVRGYKPGRFSFNVKGGRCENCFGYLILS